MRRPRAICFDMGFTLLRHRPTSPELYSSVLRDYGHEHSLEQLEAASARARDFYGEAVRTRRDFESSMELATEFWTEYNHLVLDHLGVESDRAEIVARIFRTAWSPEIWELFPETLRTLEGLRQRGIAMAVVSNFVDTLPAVCELHDLSPYFETIIASVHAGAMKPDSRIFELALRRLGVDPADAWHVGDNYWADVLGARAAGLTPVLVDRERAVERPDCAVVRSLDELLPLLDTALRPETPDSEVAA